VASLERQIAKEKEDKLARERQIQEEKKRAAAEARFKADAPARQKVSDIVKANLDKQRAEELKKSAGAQQKLQQALAPSQRKTAGQQLCDLAYDPNTPNWNDCMVKMQPAPAPPVPPSAPAPTALESLFKRDTAPKGQSVPIPAPLTKQQFDYLKANATSLQPEQRKLAAPLAAPTAPVLPKACSTFGGPLPAECPDSAEPTPSLPAAQSGSSSPNPFSDPTPEAIAASKAKQRETEKAEWQKLTEQAASLRVQMGPDCARMWTGRVPQHLGCGWFGRACRQCRQTRTCQRGRNGEDVNCTDWRTVEETCGPWQCQ
jgi:hypothetical protein